YRTDAARLRHSSCPPELRNAVSAADVEPRTLAPDLSTALHGRIPAAAIRHSARRSGPASAVRYPIRRIGTPEHDSPQQVASEWIQPRTGAARRCALTTPGAEGSGCRG